MLLESEGTFYSDEKEGRVVISLSIDFIRYYIWFVKRKQWLNLNYPAFGAHITLGLTMFHKNINWRMAYKLNGKKFKFKYDPYLHLGGKTKGFDAFYIKVESDELEALKLKLGIVELGDYRGMHITIGNRKKGTSEYWPEMIEIRK